MAGCRTNQVSRHDDKSRAASRWRRAALAVSGFTLLLGLSGMVSANAAQVSQHATASSRTWTIQKTPNQPLADINALSSVSCTSAKACTAVGTYSLTLASPIGALAERWNGTSWSLQAPARPAGAVAIEFFGVSCPSVRACTAVGVVARKLASGTLAEAWNGKSWAVQPTPTIKGATASALYSVSCTSPTACTAVGHYSTATHGALAMVERWNGTAWSLQAIPRPATNTWFFGVSCSTRTACVAVGYLNTGTGDAQLFAEAWNGAKWRVLKVPLPHGSPGGAFNAVSCTSPKACTATGTAFGTSPTLAERWNGTSWRVQPTPNPPKFTSSAGQVALDGVSCTSRTACTASGEYSPGGLAAYFAEAWNGASWKLQATPLPADFHSGALLGISCVPAQCTAVGAYSALAGQVTLAMVR